MFRLLLEEGKVIQPSEIAILGKVSKLRTFTCSYSRISNELLLKLKSLPELSELNLSGCSLEDGALPILLEMRKLQKLILAADIRDYFPNNSFYAFEATLKQRNCQLKFKKNCASLMGQLPKQF